LTRTLNRRLWMALVVGAPLAIAESSGWTPPIEIRKGKEVAVRYRAKLSGDIVWVEAVHGTGWHTYSLDNAERARKKTGVPVIGIEQPTVISIDGSAKATGKWRQSRPKDLSQPELEWYTWGFEDRAIFATRLETREAKTVKLIINAQACKATQCAIVDDAELVVSRSRNSAQDIRQWNDLIESGDLRDVR
jgi:hypothetical protein